MKYGIAVIEGKGFSIYALPLCMLLDRVIDLPNHSFYNQMLKYIGANPILSNNPRKMDSTVLEVTVDVDEFDEIRKFCEDELCGYCQINWFEDYLAKDGFTLKDLVEYIDGE